MEKLFVSPCSRGKFHGTKLSPIFAAHRCKSCPSYKKMLWMEALRKRSLLPLRATEAQGDCGSVLEKSQNCRKRPSPRLILSLHDNFSLYHGERGEAGVESMVLHVENRVQGHGETKNGLTHWTNSQFVHVEAGVQSFGNGKLGESSPNFVDGKVIHALEGVRRRVSESWNACVHCRGEDKVTEELPPRKTENETRLVKTKLFILTMSRSF